MIRRFMLTNPCPDCADLVPVPVTTKLSDDGRGIDIVVDEEAFYDIMLLHVELNVDTHPTFWNKGDDNEQEEIAGA